ncbi:phage integrase, N-terminal SAM-like domain protein [Mycobacterium kansasii 732]|nr:phage integrase, N-terminal SAM-like domain protein [Mycobacterium kansasii 732]
MLTPLPRMRWADPIPRSDDVPPMPEAGCARRREVAVPALRKARLSAGCDRLVWLVLPARPVKGPAPHLCELRRVAPPRRARHVWAMLAAPPGPAVRARRDTGRSAHRTTGLARRLRRVSSRPPLPRSRLRPITTLSRLLEDKHPNHPHSVLERARRPGRSMGSLARALETFFTQRGLAMATDQDQRLAAGRRKKRIDGAPAGMRAAVAVFAESMLHARDRARRAGTRPRADRTIESALATVRDLACFLDTQRGKQDWALVDVADIEAFLAELPNNRARRLTVLGQFFRFARNRRLVLVDPTRGISAKRHRGFRGRTLTITQQRTLFRRWSADPAAHPHEALYGLLAIVHGVSSRELRLLQVDHIDASDRSIHLGKRPHPVPLDPVSWTALQRSLDHRETLRTNNPHVIVTRGTKADRRAASEAYMSHLLDPCGVPPKTLRTTRLADLVNTIDPKLVAAAFGMRPEGAMIYLADHIDDGRLPDRLAEPR